MALSAANFVSYVDKYTAMFVAGMGDGATYGSGDNTAPDTDSAGAGTVSSSGATITGSGSGFTGFFARGDIIKADSQYRRVQMICSDTVLVVDSAPSPAWSADTYAQAATWGRDKKARDLEDIVVGTPSAYGFGDYALVAALAAAVHGLQDYGAWQKEVLQYRTSLDAIASACVATGISGVTGVDTFATYYNIGAGGPGVALMPPDFALLWYALYGSSLSARNVYPPALASMGARTVGGAFTAGPEVDDSVFSGFTRLNLNMASWAGSSDDVEVAVSGFDASGVADTDTWTKAIGADGDTTLTSADGTSVEFVTSVTGITIGGNISAGTVTISGLIPSGRTNPPT